MKKNFIKNALLIGSGIAIATSFAIYAQPAQLGTSIQANLVNLVQYLSELHITSNGTVNGEEVLSIDGSGHFGQMRVSTVNDNMYAIMNGSEGMGPNTETVGFGAFSGDTVSNIVGIVNMFGFNQSFMSYADDVQGVENYFTAYPQGVIMAYSGVGGQKGLSITDNGFIMQKNNTPLLHIDNSGNFNQYLGSGHLLNVESRQGLYPFVGSLYQTEYAYLHGIVGSDDPINVMGVVSNGDLLDYVAVQSGGITMTATAALGSTGYDLDIEGDEGIFARGIDQGASNNMTRQDGTKINYIMRLLNDGTLMLKNYVFPVADGSANQVLATNGNGGLYWADVGASSESIQTDKITLNSSDILSLYSSPKLLVAAPGAGKYIKILGVDGKLNFGSTPYSSNSLSVYMVSDEMGSPYALYELGGMATFLNATTNTLASFGAKDGGTSSLKIEENAPVMLKSPMFDPTDGDGTLDIYITYKIIDL